MIIRTAEFVSPNHPDKLCDRIADGILDFYMAEDKYSRCAIEVCGGHSKVFITGEVTSKGKVSDDEIKKLVKDLNYPIHIISCPIIREENGLARSSRNDYLTEAERKIASTINKALRNGKKLLISGEHNSQIIKDEIIQIIGAEKLLRIDYISVADSHTLVEISGKIEQDILVSVAVYLKDTRLIDNFSYSISSSR